MQPLDPRVEIGHVRLRVADLDRTIAFYAGSLGFEITHRQGALVAFLGAGGFHHHLALHAAAPGEAAAPYRFAIRYPDRVALGDALVRIERAKVPIDSATDDGISASLFVRDPDGNQVELYYDRPPAGQGREAAPPHVVGTLDLDALRAAASQPHAAEPGAAVPVPLSEASRQRLRDLRARLLTLHKVLLDDTKVAYELDRGRVGSSGNLLQLVISDPWFAWLHPLSELVVRIDEAVEQGSPATQADGGALLDEAERLLTASESGDGFARRYYDALQRQPAVVLAHADVRRTLKSMR